MNIQHSSRTDEWYTPIWLLKMIKEVLGPIDLDPASDYFGNRRVEAAHYITKEEGVAHDDSSVPWDRVNPRARSSVTLFINPPGGKTKNRSNAELFWQKLMATREAGYLHHAIFLGFSLEILKTSQRDGMGGAARFPFCIPAKRIAFDSLDGGKISPPHSNVIVYVPGAIDRTLAFKRVFSKIGVVK